MSAAAEVTTEMVLDVASYSREVAARIAAYATHRFAGLRTTDAARETGLTFEQGRSYDRALPLLRDRFGLPEPPHAAVYRLPLLSERGRRGGHQTNHVQRGITRADCSLCVPTEVP